MKKLFEVYIEQSFISYEKILWFKKRFNVHNVTSEGWHHIILANNTDEAIHAYKCRYKTDYDSPKSCYDIISHYDNLINTIKARGIIKSFDYLKNNMWSDEFIEYCRRQFNRIDNLLL